MKNRLSTFLMVLLTALMVTCSNCKTDEPKPVIEGTWNIVSVESSVGTQGVTAKYDAAGGTLTLTATTYAIAKAGGVPTTGGSGAAAIAVTNATSGDVTLDPANTPPAPKPIFKYSDLTAKTVTLVGDVVNGTGKVGRNDLTIKLARQ